MGLLRKLLIGVLLVSAAICFGYILYLDSYYHLYGAREPKPEEGRIYAKTVYHGSHVFLTRDEGLKFNVLLPSASILCAVVGFYLATRWKYISLRFGGEKDLGILVMYKRKKDTN